MANGSKVVRYCSMSSPSSNLGIAALDQVTGAAGAGPGPTAAGAIAASAAATGSGATGGAGMAGAAGTGAAATAGAAGVPPVGNGDPLVEARAVVEVDACGQHRHYPVANSAGSGHPSNAAPASVPPSPGFGGSGPGADARWPDRTPPAGLLPMPGPRPRCPAGPRVPPLPSSFSDGTTATKCEGPGGLPI